MKHHEFENGYLTIINDQKAYVRMEKYLRCDLCFPPSRKRGDTIPLDVWENLPLKPEDKCRVFVEAICIISQNLGIEILDRKKVFLRKICKQSTIDGDYHVPDMLKETKDEPRQETTNMASHFFQEGVSAVMRSPAARNRVRDRLGSRSSFSEFMSPHSTVGQILVGMGLPRDMNSQLPSKPLNCLRVFVECACLMMREGGAPIPEENIEICLDICSRSSINKQFVVPDELRNRKQRTIKLTEIKKPKLTETMKNETLVSRKNAEATVANVTLINGCDVSGMDESHCIASIKNLKKEISDIDGLDVDSKKLKQRKADAEKAIGLLVKRIDSIKD